MHLGGAGSALGNGAQNCVVQGNVVTDTSGSAIELGNDDMRNATGADQTLGNTIADNHVFNAPVEFRAGIGIDVGYAATSSIVHNQIDHTPYTGISIGWGGWPDKQGQPLADELLAQQRRLQQPALRDHAGPLGRRRHLHERPDHAEPLVRHRRDRQGQRHA